MSPRAPRPGATVVLLVVSLTCLVGGEVLLARLRPAIVPYRDLPRTGPPYLAAHSEYLPFTLPPGVDFPHATGEYQVVYAINPLGYRGPSPAAVTKPPGARRLLILGDSHVLGWGVDEEDSLAGRVRHRLSGEGWEVINAGYRAGYSPDCYYAYLQREGWALEPDRVALFVYTGNDLTDMSDNRWRARDAEGGPISVATRRYYADHQGRIMRVLRGELPWRYRLPLLRESRLFIGLAAVLDPDPSPLPREEAAARLEEVLVLLDGQARRRRIPLMIYLLPDRLCGTDDDRGTTASHDLVRLLVESRGLPFVDLRAVLTPEAYFLLDGHLNPEGHRRLAAELLRPARGDSTGDGPPHEPGRLDPGAGGAAAAGGYSALRPSQ